MVEGRRSAKARLAAEKYAPKPGGSSLTYGFIGVVLLVLGLIAFEVFYGANIFRNPVIIGLAVVVVFVAGVLLRKRRKKLHVAAYKHEYERQADIPQKGDDGANSP